MLARIVTAAALVVGGLAVGPDVFVRLFGQPHWQAENAAAIVATDEEAAPAPVRDKHGSAGTGRAAIYADIDGHFRAEARVRGRPIPVVVDTGATVVAINLATARQLGVTPAANARRAEVQTANGRVMATAVVLPDVTLGGIRVNNVQAVVLPDNALDTTLLGMSFLGRLKEWKAGSGRLELVQ